MESGQGIAIPVTVYQGISRQELEKPRNRRSRKLFLTCMTYMNLRYWRGGQIEIVVQMQLSKKYISLPLMSNATH